MYMLIVFLFGPWCSPQSLLSGKVWVPGSLELRLLSYSVLVTRSSWTGGYLCLWVYSSACDDATLWIDAFGVICWFHSHIWGKVAGSYSHFSSELRVSCFSFNAFDFLSPSLPNFGDALVGSDCLLARPETVHLLVLGHYISCGTSLWRFFYFFGWVSGTFDHDSDFYPRLMLFYSLSSGISSWLINMSCDRRTIILQ